MELENIKGKIEKATIAVATVNSEGRPHNIAIMNAKVKDEKVIITDVCMKKTIENIKDNKNISLVLWEGEKGWRIDGKAEYHDSGEHLDFVKSLPGNKGFSPKGALVINIEDINKLG